MKILIVGDVHNRFGKLNTLINVKRPDLIICCGEFGYWPYFENSEPIEKIKTHGAKLLWVEGNHEDLWTLRDRKSNELAPNIIYMPRGSTYQLDDGRKILFMGGADSIDKDVRYLGVDWFPEEVITYKDLQNLPNCEIDIFITHTCPQELVAGLAKWPTEKDPSNQALSELWKMYKPDLWFFGHWHFFTKGKLGKTKWFALSHIEEGRFWYWLPEKK